jgi:hypothetical protein
MPSRRRKARVRRERYRNRPDGESCYSAAGDTFGISKILSDYLVETTFYRMSNSSTRVEISHYYSTKTLKAKLLNLIAKMKLARETQDMLNAVKRLIES